LFISDIVLQESYISQTTRFNFTDTILGITALH